MLELLLELLKLLDDRLEAVARSSLDCFLYVTPQSFSRRGLHSLDLCRQRLAMLDAGEVSFDCQPTRLINLDRQVYGASLGEGAGQSFPGDLELDDQVIQLRSTPFGVIIPLIDRYANDIVCYPRADVAGGLQSIDRPYSRHRLVLLQPLSWHKSLRLQLFVVAADTDVVWEYLHIIQAREPLQDGDLVGLTLELVPTPITDDDLEDVCLSFL